jgi:hypothetical protein
MKRILWAFALCWLVVAPAHPQRPGSPPAVPEKQWQELLTAVSGEEWDAAFGLSSKLLKQAKEDDGEKTLARLRYIHMYAAAGRVTEGRMSFEELEKALQGLAGKEVVLPYREITQECGGALNVICPSQGARDRLFVSASNRTGTSILAFEYVQLKEDFDAEQHEGRQASIGGVIQRIAPNPNKSRAIVMRVYITEGYVNLRQPEARKADSVGPAA